MGNEKRLRLNAVCKHLKVGQGTLVDFLKSKGIDVGDSSSIISSEAIVAVEKEFGPIIITDARPKEEEKKPVIKKESISLEKAEDPTRNISVKKEDIMDSKPTSPKILGKIDLEELNKFGKNSKDNKSEAAPKVVAPKVEEPIVKKEHPATKPQPATPKVKIQTAANKSQPNMQKPQQANQKAHVEPQPAKLAPKPVHVEERIASADQMNRTFDERQADNDTTKLFRNDSPKISGPKVLGTIDLSLMEKKKSSPADRHNKRNRIKKDGKVDINNPNTHAKKGDGAAKPGDPNKPQRQFTPGSKPNGQGGNNNNRPNTAGGNRPNTAGANRPNTGAGANRPNTGAGNNAGGFKKKPFGNSNYKKPVSAAPVVKAEITDEDVQKQIKDTLARLTAKGNKNKGSARHRRDKRDAVSARTSERLEKEESEKNILKVTEFVTVSELARMMNVQVTEVIAACMNLGLMVSINQRLDAEALVVVAEEFDFKVEFVTADLQESIESIVDSEEELIERSPIITVMGHVDHGKTSLLDFIRQTNVIAGEAGGITQHIGAYSVKMNSGRRITFLDTPGHEAFTAMRARGASVTDVAIIIIAADDSVMPQTKEAINHAAAAGVPIVFAINKIDKPGANTDRIREQLSQMNYLTEDWGGKYQCQEISAKKGVNVDELLEKVLLEADILNLRANPNRKAEGAIIESSLDKGRGYMTTILVQKGTLRIGDAMLSGMYSGRVKAMFNERGQRITEAGPSMPVLVLGLNGAPQAGDTFNVLDDEKQARDIANKREQLHRMQGLKTQKHITLDEIGRRIAIGNFQELNVIIKGDVDGSVEALTDSLIRESHTEVQVNVIHKAVGQISESDVLLAAASNAIIIGFQVRPSAAARRLADSEEIEIRLYSIIYDAINEIQGVIKGMLAPKFKEEITCTVEVMETFKITKVGTIAGCLVREGKITRNTGIRIIRDGIVVFTGKLGSLKRFKDSVKEVPSGMECGLNIEGYNDIQVGDFVEGYEDVEVAR
ncbi:MAG: translation initiation factor IF-2 [Rikenellaceae bacterium]